MDTSKLALLFQYALAAAAQEDRPFDRELGPIHLLKYAYLADLAHAEANEGRTFTGVAWRFHHFGPWAVEAWEEIPNAMEAVGAQHKSFSSRYKEDNHRWWLETEREPDSIVAGLPGPCARTIRRAVHEFGNDTSALLHHVYKTPPMLQAAPGDLLEFRPPPPPSETPDVEERPALPKLSKTKLKKLRAVVKEKLAAKEQKPRSPAQPAPRYDDVFAQGTAWLDSLAGEPISEQEGVLEFDPSIWKSRARNDGELP